MRAGFLRWVFAWHEVSVVKRREQMFRSRRRANAVAARLDQIDPPKPLPTIDASELFPKRNKNSG